MNTRQVFGRVTVARSFVMALGMIAVQLGSVVPTWAATGTVTEFGGIRGVTAGSTPAGITVGPDGNLWFTESGGGRIGRISPSGDITEFPLAQGARPYQIAAGSDGNLWFTDGGGGVGRMTPTGDVIVFSAGISQGGTPLGIAAGPDGNLWFTELNGDRIGRITPAGTVTEFSAGISPNRPSPSGIAAGPDGNLWFTEQKGDRIGRITPAGTVTEFSAGISPNSGPGGIAAGPDGNLWFVESGADRVGRITPAGTVTEFSTGISANSGPVGIAAGPDGNLWFTEHGGNRVGRITPVGTVTEFSTGISANSGPFGITAGPDGNLWFTEQLGDRVARLEVDVPGAAASPSAVTFPSQAVGTTSSAQTVTLKSTGTAPLQVSTVTIGGANPADFAKQADSCSGQTVNPGSTCSATVTFTPTAAGSRAATLTFTDNAPIATQTVSLSGIGTKAPTHLLAAPADRRAGLFSATLTRADNGAPIAGQTVTFTVNGLLGTRTVCSAVTARNGTATCHGTIPILAVLASSYTASFAGNTIYLPTSTTGTLR